MPNSQDICQFNATTPHDLADHVMQLFTFSEDDGSVADKISQMSHAFLEAMHVSSDIALETLCSQFGESKIPGEPGSLDSYLEYLAENVVPHSMHTSSPRCLSNMSSAVPHFSHALSKLMAAMNQNMVKVESSKVLSLCERQVLAMMHRLVFDYPDHFYHQYAQSAKDTLGILTTGGTLANIAALWCARNTALGPTADFQGVEYEGLPSALAYYGYTGAVIIGSTAMHYSFRKAAGMLGLGSHNLIEIPTDATGSIDVPKLRQTVAECRQKRLCIVAIVGIAGTTDAGAVDPLAELLEIAKAAGAHFHVDAAWGGPFLFSAQHRAKLAGIAGADSVTIDGHKQLYLPLGIGMLLLQNPGLAQVIEKQADYMLRTDSADLGKRSIEGSRPATALLLHAALHLIGAKGYEFLVDQNMWKTQWMAQSIRTRPEFELLAEPQLNVLLYRYIPAALRGAVSNGSLSVADNQLINEVNRQLHHLQCQAGNTLVSRTAIPMIDSSGSGKTVALRAIIANPRTTELDINAILDDQIVLAESLTGAYRDERISTTPG